MADKLENQVYPKVAPLISAMEEAVTMAVEARGTPGFSAAAIYAARVIGRTEEAIYKYRHSVPESVSRAWTLNIRECWVAISGGAK